MRIFTRPNNGSSRAAPVDDAIEAEVVEGRPGFQKLTSSDFKSDTDIDTIVSEDVTFQGDVTSNGPVVVYGIVKGDMRCTSAVVADGAEIWGSIMAQKVTVMGYVQGNIYALHVSLRSTARVEGDIYHKQLGMELHATFEGRSQQHENPFMMAPDASTLKDIIPLIDQY